MNVFTYLSSELCGSYSGMGILVAVAGLAGYFAYRLLAAMQRRRLIGANKTLVIGMPLAEELGLSEEIRKSFIGFMQDVMLVMGARLGRSIEIKPTSIKEYEQALSSKELDLMILDGTTAVTRSKIIDVVPCHTAALSSLALVFWDKMPHHVHSLQDFSYYPYNSTVVLRNSLEEHYLAMFDGIRAHRVDSITNLIVNLKLGLARAGLMRMEHAHCLKREYNNLKYVPISLQKRCMIQDEKIGVLRENQDLLEAVEHTLADLRNDETMRHLHAKWFGA